MTSTSTNVVQANFTPPVDEQQEIIDALTLARSKGEEVDIIQMATMTTISADMKRVRDYCVNTGICDAGEWKAACKVSAVVERLGEYPKTAKHLVEIVVKRDCLTVDYQRRMKQNTPPVILGHVVTADDRKDRAIDTMARLVESKEVTTETLKEALRMIVDEFALRFRDQAVADAVNAWFREATEQRKYEIMETIICQTGTGLNAVYYKDIWERATSQFDLAEHDAVFVEAVLRKFIWQVKRKMIGLPITNHLMPVILGPQGVGKSTFVTDFLLRPIAELVGLADFRSLEDDRNMEQWRNYVLFLDEMGFANKADIEKVKNRITAATVSGRPMRTNENIQVRQNATFIGCSNKEMEQLIRDETGNRRFAALRFSSNPDWSRLTDADPYLLWTGVDEHGPDPIISVLDQLRQRQDETREQSAVEQWVTQHEVPHTLHGRKQDSTVLYTAYKAWAEEFTPGRIMDVRTWGSDFARLIKSGLVADWKKLPRSNGKSYYSFK